MRSFSFSSFIANSCLLSFFLLYLLSAVGEISTGKELYQPSPIGCLYYSLHTWVIECMYLYMCVCVCVLWQEHHYVTAAVQPGPAVLMCQAVGGT